MAEQPHRRPAARGARGAAALVIASSLVAATVGCSGADDAGPDLCAPQASTLSRIDPATGRAVWESTLTQASEVPLKIDDGNVVVSGVCGAGVVELTDGEVRYDEPLPHIVIGAVGVSGDRLFVHDASGKVTELRGISLGGEPGNVTYSGPLQDAMVAAGRLFTLKDNEVDAHDGFGEGATSWSAQLATGDRLASTGSLLLVTGRDGSTYALDAAEGTLVWRTVPPVASPSYDLRVTTAPGTVLTAARTQDPTLKQPEQAFVYATRTTTGQLRWTRPAEDVLAADRKTTVLRTAQAQEGVDTRTGALLWSRPAAGGRDVEVPTAVISGDTVVVSQPGSAVLGLDRTTGRVLWQGLETWTVLVAGEVVVALTDDGVTAIDPRTGTERWSRPVRRDQLLLAAAPEGELLVLDSDRIPHQAD